jgi:hypothetical protein
MSLLQQSRRRRGPGASAVAIIVAAAICSAAFACRRQTIAASTTCETATRTVTVNGHERKMPRGDELYWRVGCMVPGFGGFYLADAVNPTIVLLDPRDSAAARVAVSRLLGGCSSAHPCRYVRGQFTYVDLATWRDSLTRILFASGDATSMGVDQRANRVTVGAAHMSDSATVAAHISALGIPLKAVIIGPGIRGVPE